MELYLLRHGESLGNATGDYSLLESELSDTFVDGRLLVRGGDGIHAFDLRQKDQKG